MFKRVKSVESIISVLNKVIENLDELAEKNFEKANELNLEAAVLTSEVKALDRECAKALNVASKLRDILDVL